MLILEKLKCLPHLEEKRKKTHLSVIGEANNSD